MYNEAGTTGEVPTANSTAEPEGTVTPRSPALDEAGQPRHHNTTRRYHPHCY
jgi:hypothetical protein